MGSKRKQLCQYNQESPFVLGTVFFPQGFSLQHYYHQIWYSFEPLQMKDEGFFNMIFSTVSKLANCLSRKKRTKTQSFLVVLRFYTPKGLTCPPKKGPCQKERIFFPTTIFQGTYIHPRKLTFCTQPKIDALGL